MDFSQQVAKRKTCELCNSFFAGYCYQYRQLICDETDAEICKYYKDIA